MTDPHADELEVPQVVNLSQVSVEQVKAELVRASHATIRKLEAEELDANGVIAAAVVTGKFSGHHLAVGAINAKQAEVKQAFIGGIRGETVTAQSKTGAIVATNVNAAEANALVVAGAKIHAEKIRTAVLIGRNVNGNVETLVETRTALLIGAVAGLVYLAGRLLFDRKK